MTAPADDQDIWNIYAKGVKKIGSKAEDPAPVKPRKPKAPEPPLFEEALKAEPPRTEQSASTQGVPEKKAEPVPPRPWKKEPLDLRVERNMSLGDVMIEAKLDLHGKTEAAAHEAFSAFIETQQKRGKRMLLVITGKGQDGASVLKSNLPRWCDTAPFQDVVMAVRTAAQHHGGEGAYYILLRKTR